MAKKPDRKTPAKKTKKAAKPAAADPATPPETPKKTVKAPSKAASGSSLVIVESPAKAKTILKFLGRNFHVMASMGHVRDLPKWGMGLDVENHFEPRYRVLKDRKKIVDELKKEAKRSAMVYLAPDPDREGEAIAWHLAESLGVAQSKIRRITFNEITERAVQEAIRRPSEINMDRVNAQQARRILDRLVGYRLSPLLWKKVARGLSAGRVQSVAVKLIVDREREIDAFKSEEYWRITARLRPDGAKDDVAISALLITVDGKPVRTSAEGADVWISSESQAREHAEKIRAYAHPLRTGGEDVGATLTGAKSDKGFTIGAVEQKERTLTPPPPLNTSLLQQQASNLLGYSAKNTMRIAQQLYEGVALGDEGPVGLITYMRTDAFRFADEAMAECRDFIRAEFGAAYLPPQPRAFKARKGAQEAHEAIRPTSFLRTPDRVRQYLTPQQLRLYTLIWNRAVSSQMSSAQVLVTRLLIQAGPYGFSASGRVIQFDGFYRLRARPEPAREPEPADAGNDPPAAPSERTEEGEDAAAPGAKREEEADQSLPDVKEGQSLALLGLDPTQHFTQPPPRYTEASLVKTLEKLGIGRPSTYAPIISTVQDRGYVRKEARQLKPTELGVLVTDKLKEHFPVVMDVEFTSRMEEELDEVEEAKLDWHKVLDNFYAPFSVALAAAETEMKDLRSTPEQTDQVCEKCGKPMVVKWSRHGRFMGCSGFPDCKNIKSLTPEGEEPAAEVVDRKCPKCGSAMVIKSGRFGRFLACSAYPECKTTQPIPTGVPCAKPGCAGELVPRRARKGGRRFYGCSRYPDCDYVAFALPKKDAPAAEAPPADPDKPPEGPAVS